jgi:voltage-gated potassium channel
LYSEDKKSYIKSNIIELIAIIPFGSMFRAVRIFRLLRFFSVLGRAYKKWGKFLKTNNFNYILMITAFMVLIGTILIRYVEGMTFKDSLWWTFVTITTVGYGDLSPATSLGRIIAALLMLGGIGFIGMLTGTIATFFIKEPKHESSYKGKSIELIKNQLENFEDLTDEDIDTIYKTLKVLKEDV